MSFPNLIVKVSSVMQETAIALNAANEAKQSALESRAFTSVATIADLPETIEPGKQILTVASGTMWRGLAEGESSLPAGTPWPVKGYKVLSFIYQPGSPPNINGVKILNDFNGFTINNPNTDEVTITIDHGYTFSGECTLLNYFSPIANKDTSIGKSVKFQSVNALSVRLLQLVVSSGSLSKSTVQGGEFYAALYLDRISGFQ
jgi:hypothetical protein